MSLFQRPYKVWQEEHLADTQTEEQRQGQCMIASQLPRSLTERLAEFPEVLKGACQPIKYFHTSSQVACSQLWLIKEGGLDPSRIIAIHHIFFSCELLMNLVQFKSKICFYEYVSLENHVAFQSCKLAILFQKSCCWIFSMR